MSIEGWKYYNHSAVPTCAPHESANLTPLYDGSIWKRGGVDGKTPLMARWASDWDCGHETNWWYVIKDEPFDVGGLKAKRRYVINSAKKKFVVSKLTDLSSYAEDLFNITMDAYKGYPPEYRPHIDKTGFETGISNWSKNDVFGAFSRLDNKLVGFAVLYPNNQYSDFRVMKVIRSYESQGVNAALVSGILEYYNEQLKNGYYICDGARNISHKTAFQDYLEKYFGFRKAYCHLQVEYSWCIGVIVKCMYPFRKLLEPIDGIKLIHNINSILKMEEIVRGI